MSDSTEINAVFEEEINKKSRLVENKFGKSPFYDNFEGFSFGSLFENAGIEHVRCSEYTPKTRKWSKK